ncbi:MAG: hypothetical protein H0X27_06590 [Caulobacteraceae bacterium]|nr:hypothetical protein [Caulobacteraceae bacterium]
MTDDDIDALLLTGSDAPLLGLEAAIWRGVAERAAADRRMAVVGALQGGALAVALAAGLTWGGASARSFAEPGGFGVFSPRMALAPSTRLIGAGE